MSSTKNLNANLKSLCGTNKERRTCWLWVVSTGTVVGKILLSHCAMRMLCRPKSKIFPVFSQLIVMLELTCSEMLVLSSSVCWVDLNLSLLLTVFLLSPIDSLLREISHWLPPNGKSPSHQNKLKHSSELHLCFQIEQSFQRKVLCIELSSKAKSFVCPGGKRSLHSGSSIDSNSKSSGLTKQMNLFLRTKSDSGKKLSDEVSFLTCIIQALEA